MPPLMEWRHRQCDLNKEVEVSCMVQQTATDIQLKDADRVFRLYLKS
jgi:hypothetical protein